MRLLLVVMPLLSLIIPIAAASTPEDLVFQLVSALNSRDPRLLGQIYDDFFSPTLCNDFDFMMMETLIGGSSRPSLSLRKLVESRALVATRPKVVRRMDGRMLVVFGLEWSYATPSEAGSPNSEELDLVVTWDVEWRGSSWKAVLQRTSLLREVVPFLSP